MFMYLEKYIHRDSITMTMKNGIINRILINFLDINIRDIQCARFSQKFSTLLNKDSIDERSRERQFPRHPA